MLGFVFGYHYITDFLKLSGLGWRHIRSHHLFKSGNWAGLIWMSCFRIRLHAGCQPGLNYLRIALKKNLLTHGVVGTIPFFQRMLMWGPPSLPGCCPGVCSVSCQVGSLFHQLSKWEEPERENSAKGKPFFFFLSFFLSFFWHAEVPGTGIKLHHSSDNSGSLTHWATRKLWEVSLL